MTSTANTEEEFAVYYSIERLCYNCLLIKL